MTLTAYLKRHKGSVRLAYAIMDRYFDDEIDEAIAQGEVYLITNEDHDSDVRRFSRVNEARTSWILLREVDVCLLTKNG